MDIQSFFYLVKRMTLAATTILTLFSVAACKSDTAEDGGNVVSVSTLSAPGIGNSATQTRKIRYRMPAVRGGFTDANTMLFVPGGTIPAGGWPLVVWAHGTTGVADGCAPSRDYAALGDPAVVNALLNSGFAVVAPDYEGLDAPGVHPYYSRKSHAESVLQAVKAATTLSEFSISKRWSIIGHSQGGHVALSAAEFAGELGSGYDLRSVAVFAPGSDLIASSNAIFALIDSLAAVGEIEGAANVLYQTNYNAAMVLLGLQAIEPRIDPMTLAGKNLARLLDTARNDNNCRQFRAALFEDIRGYVLGGGSVLDYPGVRRDWYQSSLVQDVINNNRVGTTLLKMPILVIQGSADVQVPFSVTSALITAMQSKGTAITRIDVPDGDHDSIVADKFADAIAFVKARQ